MTEILNLFNSEICHKKGIYVNAGYCNLQNKIINVVMLQYL